MERDGCGDGAKCKFLSQETCCSAPPHTCPSQVVVRLSETNFIFPRTPPRPVPRVVAMRSKARISKQICCIAGEKGFFPRPWGKCFVVAPLRGMERKHNSLPRGINNSAVTSPRQLHGGRAEGPRGARGETEKVTSPLVLLSLSLEWRQKPRLLIFSPRYRSDRRKKGAHISDQGWAASLLRKRAQLLLAIRCKVPFGAQTASIALYRVEGRGIAFFAQFPR